MSSAAQKKTSLLLLVFLLTAGALVGCGKKGPVRPLLHPVPVAPEEFTLRQQGRQMLLVWTLPPRNEDGSPLTDLAGFRLYRGLYDAGDDCPSCLQTPNLWRIVDLEYLRDCQRIGNRFYLNDAGLEVGQGYQYRIIPFTRWGQDGRTALARLVISDPPPAPAGVDAEYEKGRLVVTWQSAESLPEGSELIGYSVYRRRPGGSFPPAPRHDSPLTGTTYADGEFETGKTYLYAVRVVTRQGDRIIESPLSDLVAVSAFSGE